MLETLIPAINHLNILIRLPLDFAFDIVFIRGILAPKIVSDIEHTGFKKINIVHDVVHVINMFLPDKAGRKAISEHWQMRAKGDGHEAGSVADCYDGKCGELLAG